MRARSPIPCRCTGLRKDRGLRHLRRGAQDARAAFPNLARLPAQTPASSGHGSRASRPAGPPSPANCYRAIEAGFRWPRLRLHGFSRSLQAFAARRVGTTRWAARRCRAHRQGVRAAAAAKPVRGKKNRSSKCATAPADRADSTRAPRIATMRAAREPAWKMDQSRARERRQRFQAQSECGSASLPRRIL